MLNIDDKSDDDFQELVKLKSYDKFCNVWVATAIIGSALVSGAVTAYTTNKATSAQQKAITEANRIQQEQYAQTRQDLAPYREMGARAGTELENRLPFLTSPIDVSEELNNPDSTAAKAYNFTKTQGLKAVQNSSAARGLGVSGAALKGAANFVTGLADNTYGNLFQMENVNRTNSYNRLKGLVDTGGNAAAQTANLGQRSSEVISGNTVGSGNVEAAGLNRIGNSVNTSLGNLSGYAMYRGIYGNTAAPPQWQGPPTA